jgi:hypothetical protein
MVLTEIVKELETAPDRGAGVPISQVRKWMISEDTDILGATYGFLSNDGQVNRVSPPLEFDEVFDFMLRYYEFCLRTDPKSQWANSRYSAGWDLAGWFAQMWDEKRDTKYFQAIKAMLEKLYISADPELKACIEQAIVEHLFERKPIRKFFENWAHSPQLRPAYDAAALWVSRGGTSPLTKPRAPKPG